MPSYTSYLRQMAVLDADDTEIESWITVKGNHIPIMKGQSKEDAVKEFVKRKFENKEWNLENTKTGEKYYANKETGYFEKETKKSEPKKDYTIAHKDKSGNTTIIAEVSHHDIGEGSEKKAEKKVDNSAKKGKVYTGVMNKVRNFKAKEEGTYDYATGKPKDYSNGYSVSFHQNEPDDKGNWKSDYGRYSESEYDENAKQLVEETNGELNIGYFSGTPEVSVWVKDFRTAVKMAKKYNQNSIWNWKKGKVWTNPNYDPKKNPMKQ